MSGRDALKIPTVHLNGTSREELCRQLEEAGHAVWEAINAISHASPNGRDYYPQGPSALREAINEHDSRLKRLQSVHEELQIIREAIDS